MGSCLVVFIILMLMVYFPYQISEHIGDGTHIIPIVLGWYTILGTIIYLTATKKNNIPPIQPDDFSDTPTDDSNSFSHVHRSLSYDYLDKEETEKYISILQKFFAQKQSINNTIETLTNSAHEIQEKINNIIFYKDKPFYCSKKKWLNIHNNELSILNTQLDDITSKIDNNRILLEKLEKSDNNVYIIDDKNTSVFNQLVKSFNKIKTSCNITGLDNLKDSSVDSEITKNDLKRIRYAISPYSLIIGFYRFYIFPKRIFVFDIYGRFYGIFFPNSINCTNLAQEIVQTSSDSSNIFPDSTIKRTSSPGQWLHTKKDGSPDYRYKNNFCLPSTRTIYIQCDLTITVCGICLRNTVSSLKNSENLESSINRYSLEIDLPKQKNIEQIICNQCGSRLTINSNCCLNCSHIYYSEINETPEASSHKSPRTTSIRPLVTGTVWFLFIGGIIFSAGSCSADRADEKRQAEEAHRQYWEWRESQHTGWEKGYKGNRENSWAEQNALIRDGYDPDEYRKEHGYYIEY